MVKKTKKYEGGGDVLLSRKDFADKRAKQFADIKEENRKEKYLRDRAIGAKRAYTQFRLGGEDKIDTEPSTLEKIVSLNTMSKDDPEWQGAREMKEAITKERARMDIPKAVENYKGKKKGGTVKYMSKGGSTASKRADGCATKGKTKGRMI